MVRMSVMRKSDGLGIGIGVLRVRLQGFRREGTGGQRPGGFLEKGTPSLGSAG